jgi:hypothetical protein
MTDGKRFFTVTGLRGTRRTTARKKLERLLPERFPDQTFAFLGNPFRELPFPLLLSERDKNVHATTRLLWCWTRLNEFSVSQLRPALDAGKIVLTDGFGLDALMYATGCVDCEVENREAEELHHGLVQVRIKAQGIVPPEYFIMQADANIVDKWMVEYLPELDDLDKEIRRKFIAQQQSVIQRYFLPINGQRESHYFDPSVGIDEVVEAMIAVIGMRIRE